MVRFKKALTVVRLLAISPATWLTTAMSRAIPPDTAGLWAISLTEAVR